MKSYLEMTTAERKAELAEQKKLYEHELTVGYKLDMSRGKPDATQLNLSMDMLEQNPYDLIYTRKGTDVRNYGELAGTDEAKELFANLLGLKMENIIMGGQSSLNLMYDMIIKAYVFGVYGGSQPWGKQEKLKFLCPVPGYDRHFRITQEFGFEMVNIPMSPNGPDMEMVKQLVENDPTVKGIWCVPKYSNPQGYTYSEETVDRFANLKPAAPDFLIMWDNAYCVHEFDGEFEPFRDIISLCAEAGRPNMVYEFASTSKITFPGAGISVMASSVENINYMTKLFGVQTISYDKINQLRHVKYLKNREHTIELMKKHAEIMRPKFEMVLKMLRRELTNKGIAHWHHPTGGYFVCVAAMPGTARRTLELCKRAGVTLTEAGATYPYGVDPHDSMIRIAPSLPPIEDLEKAMKVFCTCLKIATLEKYLGITLESVTIDYL